MERKDEELPVLVGQIGPLNGQRWTLDKPLTVGRDSSCDIVISDRQISRQHARFTPRLDGVYVEDMGSRNGTHYNGKRIETSVLLEDGDMIQVSLAQQFLYLSSDATMPLELSDVSAMPLYQGRLRMEKRSRRVWVGDLEIVPPLSVAQFRMLDLLYERDGRVVSRQDLIEQVWGEEQAYEVSNQALDALVRRLRDRLAELDSDHMYIVTVRGHGLRLENPQK